MRRGGWGWLTLAAILGFVAILFFGVAERPGEYVATDGHAVDTTTIRFTAADVEYTFESTDDDLAEGASVSVYYDPEDPAGTAETAANRRWFRITAYAIAAAFAIGSGVILYVKWWRPGRPSPLEDGPA